jgi:hypothetical protein
MPTSFHQDEAILSAGESLPSDVRDDFEVRLAPAIRYRLEKKMCLLALIQVLEEALSN